MPNSPLFGRTFNALENTVRIAQHRHNLIAANIANVDTPGYRPQGIDFRAALDKALQSGSAGDMTSTHPDHLRMGKDDPANLEVVEEADRWNGFNSVDIDHEMTRLVENNLRYRTAVEMLMRKIATLKEVIREGGR